MPQHEQEEPRTTGPEDQEGPSAAEIDSERSGITDPPPNFEQPAEGNVPHPHSRGVPPGEETDEFGRRNPPENENLG